MTAAIAIALIGQFIWAVNQTASLVGIASNNWTLKLAVFHTFFNLTGVLVMIPFIPVLVQQLEKRVTVGAEKTEARKAGIEPTYLNEAARRSRHPGAPGSTADRPAR
ncbi:MAG: phosphate:Na+ symporter [Rhodothermales bacterium]